MILIIKNAMNVTMRGDKMKEFINLTCVLLFITSPTWGLILIFDKIKLNIIVSFFIIFSVQTSLIISFVRFIINKAKKDLEDERKEKFK